MKLAGSLTDIPGIKLGHADDSQGLTGCTVILCPPKTTGGVDQRGGAPGTRETDLLRPIHSVQYVHAVFLAGGSAYGLDAGSGVMQFLEEQGIGFDTGVARVPIVPGAILFDLAAGSSTTRPDKAMGYRACLAASTNETRQGNVGAGMGASVGKLLGMGSAMKSGLGMASMDAGGGVIVSACMAVNAVGDIVDRNGQILAGLRSTSWGPIRFGEQGGFADTLAVMRSFAGRQILKYMAGQHTVIGVVATNAKLSKEAVNKLAQMAQNGLPMAIRPANMMTDGDTLFALATNEISADVNLVGACAAEVVAEAIRDAVLHAVSVPGLPSASDYINHLV